MMKRGSSLPWWDVLYEMTDGRTNRIDAQAILEYFRPLHDWLRQQNLTAAESNEISDNDWRCEDFLDRKASKVKSYETRLAEIANTAAASLGRQRFDSKAFAFFSNLVCLIVVFVQAFYNY